MVLAPLEYSDCLSDSPWFRQNLYDHDRRLEKAADSIKQIEAQCRNLVNAAQKLSQAQRSFARALSEFNLQTTTGMGVQTDEEKTLASSIKKFSHVIEEVEDQRMKILECSETQYIERLRTFRTEIIGKAIHHDKKVFEKASVKFYSHLEKYLGLSTVKKNVDFAEADSQLQFEQNDFNRASLDYVDCLQSVQERIKFEFVEILSSFMYSWVTFYHVGHMQYEDFKPYLNDVQSTIQSTKDSFEETQRATGTLKSRILSVRNTTGSDPNESPNVKQGYLFVLEKKSLGPRWVKYFCIYQRETKMFSMIQKMDKADETKFISNSAKLVSCTRRASSTIDRRFCFDLATDKEPLTVQTISERDRQAWLAVMDGNEPIYSQSIHQIVQKQSKSSPDESGYHFVKSCIEYIESNGMNEEGLYRNCGVSSRVNKVINQGLLNGKLQNESDLDNRTVTSAIKTYLRNLPEPLLTFDLYGQFVIAAKMEDRQDRVKNIHYHVSQLPQQNRKMLVMLCEHLNRVAKNSGQNLMTSSNLSVCFGPTLLRPRDREQSLTTCLDIKFCNVVVELILQHTTQIFGTEPTSISSPPKPPLGAANAATSSAQSRKQYRSAETLVEMPRGIKVNGKMKLDPVRRSTAVINYDDGNQPSSSVDDPSCEPASSSLYCNTRLLLSYAPPYHQSPALMQSSRKFSTENVFDLPHYKCDKSKRAKTLYLCKAEHVGELSFAPNQIITNVLESEEPGWLIGTLNGKTGLIPANFVQTLP